MVERLFFDRVNAKAGAAAIGRQHHLVATSHADKTQSALSFMQAAVARAQIALQSAVVQPVPPGCRVLRADFLPRSGHCAAASGSEVKWRTR